MDKSTERQGRPAGPHQCSVCGKGLSKAKLPEGHKESSTDADPKLRSRPCRKLAQFPCQQESHGKGHEVCIYMNFNKALERPG